MQSEHYKYFEEQLKVAADSFEPTNTEAAWEAMQKKLDIDKNGALAIVNKLRWLDDIFLLLTILVLLVVPISKQHQDAKAITAAKSGVESSSVTKSANADSNTPTKATIVNSKSVVEEIHDNQIGVGNGISGNNIPQLTNTGIQPLADQSASAWNSDMQTKPSTPVDQKVLTPAYTSEEDAISESKYRLQRLTLSLPSAKRWPVAKQPSVSHLSPSVVAASLSKGDMANKTLRQSKILERFSISTAGMAEWTSANDGKPDGAGFGGGLLIGYKLNRKITLQTGLQYSRKLYSGGANTYQPKPGSYWDIVTINKVEADCEVWEIPLRVNYVLQQKKTYSLYATGGLAAAIMKQENYHMYFTRPNGAPGYGKPTYSTGAFHPAAALTLGAGVTKRVTNHFQVAAEPFLKLPLSGVGEGNIKLRSAGLAVGLQYQF